MPFYKMTELRHGRVGREAGRGSVTGPRAGGSSIARAWVGGSSWLDRGCPRAGRAGLHGTKACASGTLEACLTRSVG
jgi:hypothetical protein